MSLTLGGKLCAQKKNNKKDTEPPTQVLAPLPDPPDAVVAEVARLSFQVSPLSNKGLLTPQIRDALKALLRDNHGAQIVKLRAFVSGSGDLRRVQTIVAEEFTERKLAMPAISTIQVGALPMVGAQVVIEATSVEKRLVNPGGIYFLQAVGAKEAGATLDALKMFSQGFEMLRVTCYLSSIENALSTRTLVAASFPGSAVDIVQTQRQSLEPFAACDGVARGPAAWQELPPAPRRYWYRTRKIVMTGTKLVFRGEEADIRLVFQRLIKAIEPLGASPSDIFWTDFYPLTNPVATKLAELREEFVNVQSSISPRGLLFEGLPSTDATAAIELMAAVP